MKTFNETLPNGEIFAREEFMLYDYLYNLVQLSNNLLFNISF